jgi:hypothetical protein
METINRGARRRKIDLVLTERDPFPGLYDGSAMHRDDTALVTHAAGWNYSGCRGHSCQRAATGYHLIQSPSSPYRPTKQRRVSRRNQRRGIHPLLSRGPAKSLPILHHINIRLSIITFINLYLELLILTCSAAGKVSTLQSTANHLLIDH